MGDQGVGVYGGYIRMYVDMFHFYRGLWRLDRDLAGLCGGQIY